MAKYRYSNNNNSFLDDETKKMYLAVVGCAVFVVIALVLCLVLQGGGNDDGEIPVVMQGDEEQNISDIPLTSDSEVVSISDGNTVIIDQQGGAVDEFTVTVSGTDGVYNLTNVHKAEASTLTISGQNSESFSFELNTPNGTVSGGAYFISANGAIYDGSGGRINFSFQSAGISIYQDGIISDLGSDAVDGYYIKGTPTYIEEEMENAQQNNYDINLHNSDTVKKALQSLMSDEDYERMNYLFSLYPDGHGVVYYSAEQTYDKNGNEINVDSEMKAIKYIAFEQGTGEEVVLICTADGKVYAGVCDGSQYRYYTNDANYKTTAPKSITGQAKAKSMELVYA